MEEEKVETLKGECICGNVSNYDKESLNASTININGVDIVLDCLCEDELLRKILSRRMSKERMGELLEPLMSDERDEILDLYGNEKLEE